MSPCGSSEIIKLYVEIDFSVSMNDYSQHLFRNYVGTFQMYVSTFFSLCRSMHFSFIFSVHNYEQSVH